MDFYGKAVLIIIFKVFDINATDGVNSLARRGEKERAVEVDKNGTRAWFISLRKCVLLLDRNTTRAYHHKMHTVTHLNKTGCLYACVPMRSFAYIPTMYVNFTTVVCVCVRARAISILCFV